MKRAHESIQEAYRQMATVAKYRPQAPGDGMGTVFLSQEEAEDKDLLDSEARTYATRFIEEEDGLQFHIGCSNFETNKVFVYSIEAARLLAGAFAEAHALKVLELAVKELKRVIAQKNVTV